MDPNDFNKSFVNIPTVRSDTNFYGFYRVHANSDIAFGRNLPEHDKFRFECATRYYVKSAAFIMKSNSIESDNMHPKFIRILTLILPFITHLFNTNISGMYPI